MIFKGNGVVWDVANNRVLCRFADGELATEDATIIDKLTALGYPHDAAPEVKPARKRGAK